MNFDPSVNEVHNTAVVAWSVAGTPSTLESQEKGEVLCCIYITCLPTAGVFHISEILSPISAPWGTRVRIGP